MNGKSISKEPKAIRRAITEENGIALKIPERTCQSVYPAARARCGVIFRQNCCLMK